jgi:coenzyme PQQ precursor peptide PqqA
VSAGGRRSLLVSRYDNSTSPIASGQVTWHANCFPGPLSLTRPNELLTILWSVPMSWTKPEAEIVAVTMEVTAYVATL